jgi:hypothetical protein
VADLVLKMDKAVSTIRDGVPVSPETWFGVEQGSQPEASSSSARTNNFRASPVPAAESFLHGAVQHGEATPCSFALVIRPAIPWSANP